MTLPPPPPSPRSPTNARLAFSCILSFSLLCRKLFKWKRSSQRHLKPPHHRFSYTLLRRATSSFSASNRLGQGGFGQVFRGVLPSGQEIAVKLMDSCSLQGEREFQNELTFAQNMDSHHIVSLIGFSSYSKKSGRRLLLVYELMHNGSLQDALLNRKCPELMDWKKRFDIAVDVAKGLEFLHFGCNPPVIHGDVKPSNVLLDFNFNAKIADFGLARVKNEKIQEKQIGRDFNEDHKDREVVVVEKINGVAEDENRFFNEETASVTSATTNTSLEQTNIGEERSPESFMKILDLEVSPETVEVEKDHSGMLGNKKMGHDRNSSKVNPHSGKVVDIEHGRVKDYVMEWVLSEIKDEKGKSDQVAAPGDDSKLSGKQEGKRKLERWTSLREQKKKDDNHPARKWWREEFYEELSKKKNKKQGLDLGRSDGWWKDFEDPSLEQKRELKKKKSQRRGSWGSIDWWLDGFSGELWTGRSNSKEWASAETPKSSVSSTPSMRGTVCYTAPEYRNGGDDEQLSEKCDVYSYGVLLLVLVSGRRPLQVTVSPKSELEHVNLISRARLLACKGRLLDLVDPATQFLNQEQAILCIKVALLCLQRSAAKRPTIIEVLEMLSGKRKPPHLPSECSPSPPMRFPFKSQERST